MFSSSGPDWARLYRINIELISLDFDFRRRCFRLSSSSSTRLESRDAGKMAAVEQERYAFSRRNGGYETYGGCHVGFPTTVELQLQSPAAAVLGAGVPGTALTRTRVT